MEKTIEKTKEITQRVGASDPANSTEVGSMGSIKARGSGTDLNSDSHRLHDQDNFLDKLGEDSFPASDPPSTTPMTGMGRKAGRERTRRSNSLPPDFKDNPVEQFKYGRRVEDATHHFDTSTHRHAIGNPDVGNIDLGTIEADLPAEPDDIPERGRSDDGF